MHRLDDNNAACLDFQRPELRLDSIVLPGDLGERVAELIREWALSEKLLRYGMRPRNRLLLYGPSGNGKTTLAAAVATELDVPLGYVRYSEIVGSHLGETEQHLSQVFRGAAHHPCVLFFDEADSLCAKRTDCDEGASRARNNTVNTMLLELDRLPAETVVIFATNFEQVLDGAMRRRITLTLELPAPDANDLRRLVALLRRQHPLWPLDGFDAETCGATSFAECEQMAIDHARRLILDEDFDPLGLEGRPRSAWLREQVSRQRENGRELVETAPLNRSRST